MKNNEIKVIKRTLKCESGQIKVVTPPAKSENNIRLRLGNVVKDWISERRESSRIEKLFSDNNILAWKMATSK